MGTVMKVRDYQSCQSDWESDCGRTQKGKGRVTFNLIIPLY